MPRITPGLIVISAKVFFSRGRSEPLFCIILKCVIVFSTRDGFMDFRTIFPLVLLPSCLFAAVNLNVSLGDSIKPVTHVATGSLYGLTETLPSNIEKDVAPLKPNVFLSPARSGSGRQQGIGGAFLVAPRVESIGAKIQIRCSACRKHRCQNPDSLGRRLARLAVQVPEHGPLEK